MARRGEDGTASTEAGAAAGHFEQAQYMREVRLRHQDNLAADYGAPVRPYMMVSSCLPSHAIIGKGVDKS